jgi:hypothetical protein
MIDELGNGQFQGWNAAVDASLDLARGQKCEEAFDLIEPRGARWCQVNVPMRPVWRTSCGSAGSCSGEVDTGSPTRTCAMQESTAISVLGREWQRLNSNGNG